MKIKVQNFRKLHAQRNMFMNNNFQSNNAMSRVIRIKTFTSTAA